LGLCHAKLKFQQLICRCTSEEKTTKTANEDTQVSMQNCSHHDDLLSINRGGMAHNVWQRNAVVFGAIERCGERHYQETHFLVA